MSDPTKVGLWTGADVYIGDDTNPAGPTDTTTAWAAGWEAVGLLDGDEGFTESREDDSEDKYAWGGALIRTVKSKHKRTVTFAALEDNDVVFALVNPGSTRTTTSGTTTETIKVPTSKVFRIGFEVRDGGKIKRRYAKRAEVVKVEDIKENEKDPTVYKLTVVIYPESDNTLWHTVADLTP